jgi:ribonucleotide monophosphatase NagD (HAD superfamily)
MNIAIDFDGTIVQHEYPIIGEPVPYAIESIKGLKKQGHSLILYTMRGNINRTRYNNLGELELFSPLQEAKDYCIQQGVKVSQSFQKIRKDTNYSLIFQENQVFGNKI